MLYFKSSEVGVSRYQMFYYTITVAKRIHNNNVLIVFRRIALLYTKGQLHLMATSLK